MAEFSYQDPFPLAKDTSRYRLLTKEHGLQSIRLDGHGQADDRDDQR